MNPEHFFGELLQQYLAYKNAGGELAKRKKKKEKEVYCSSASLSTGSPVGSGASLSTLYLNTSL